VLECEEYAGIFNQEHMTLAVFPPHGDQVGGGDGFERAFDAAQRSFRPHFASTSPVDVTRGHGSKTSRTKGRLDQHPVLDRLTLNVSTTCDLACKYCYADSGTYYTSGMLMDRNTALSAVNYVARNFSSMERLNFFGGEPTLNEPIIELVCEYTAYLHSRGVLSSLPRFGLTTNAYAISSQMLKALRTYDFRVTVSLDGPKEIHDRLRVRRDNSGTYDAVVENVEKIAGMGIVPEFECTYTAEHLQASLDLVALMDFFYDSFQCRTLHCPIVVAEPGSRWFVPRETASELYGDAIRYSMDNLAVGIPKSISAATRLLNSLAGRTPICHYCPAGKSALTINADGNVYACFMLMRGEGFCLGNVNGEDHGFGDPSSIRSLLENADKEQNPACRACWAQSLCFGCLGEDLAREGPAIGRSEIPGESGLCDSKRKLVEVFLASGAKVCLHQLSRGSRTRARESHL
jgi:uncharacterized protein